MKLNQKIKLFIILGIEFAAIAMILILIFFAGKRVYTVTFDLNGGTLLSGDPVQKITQGHNATPPTVTKEGCYFLKWSGSYKEVTRDVIIEAIWEYETSYGVVYDSNENSNYCVISESFPGLQGDIYVGAYNNGKKVLGINDEAFINRDGIKKLHFLDGILTIGNKAFAGCTSLETIELPDTAVTIGDEAFYGCSSLKSVILPSSLKAINRNTFVGCSSLEEIILPEGLERIEENAFYGCANLKSISLPSSLKYIAKNAFADCRGLEEVIIAEGLEFIDDGAFNSCDNLTSITLPKSLKTLGDAVFSDCTSLENVVILEGLTTIGEKAFFNCESLIEVNIPTTVLGIGYMAFNQESITIYGLTYIENPVIPFGWHKEWKTASAVFEWKLIEEVVEEESTDVVTDTEE